MIFANSSMNQKVLPLSLVLALLMGFTDFLFKDDAVDVVVAFKQQTKNTTKPNVSLDGLDPKPLMPYTPYEFASGAANPFVVKNFVTRPGFDASSEDIANCTDENCGDGPPLPHAKFFLENYNIDQLAMIGTMTDRRRGRVALIQTPDSGVVYAANGEYIGRNNGLILSVNNDRVIIREKYRSPKGWQDRMARLPLLKK